MKLWRLLSLCCGLVVISLSFHARGPLTFEERVKAQEAIERVYYRHRVWPKENSKPKPSFEEMVPREVIEKRVTDYLKKSAVLGELWQRPLTGEQLQAEIDRMARNTKDPETLKELFAALGYDPYIVAECLSRPVLADRLVRTWYAYDPRLHAETRGTADALKRESDWSGFRDRAGVSLSDSRFDRVGHRFLGPGRPEDLPDEGELPALFQNLSRDLSPIEKPLVVVDQQEEYWVVTRVEPSAGTILTVHSALVMKHSFQRWWDQVRTEVDLYQALADLPSYENCPMAMPRAESTLLPESWVPMNAPPSCRVRHAAIWTGSEMIIWGGDNGNPDRWLSTGGRYNPATDTWTPTANDSKTPSGRNYPAAVWTGSKMIIWGGCDSSSCTNDGAAYDPIADSWSRIATCPLPARGTPGAVWTGSRMIVWGGAWGSFFNDGASYEPVNDEWQVISSLNAPSGRNYFTILWTGTEMLVWGGLNGHDALNTGGLYSPSTDTWRSTSTTDAPIGRLVHSGIWADGKMFVWGGRLNHDYDNEVTNTGGVYTLSTDTWAPINTVNAPSAREFHTAVWTGSKMIIWGGGLDFSSSVVGLNTGGIYDPVLNQWVATDTTTAPDGRQYHSAIWTGDEMIVWGGTFSDETTGVMNTGGRYNPGTDRWVATSTGGGNPHYRTYASTVWTGTEMIVWGGTWARAPVTAEIQDLNSGGRYNPILDHWLPTSVGTNVPGIRMKSAAVWTGTHMVIWGGYHYYPISTNYGDGAKYDPDDDTWTPIATSPLAGRRGHTAVWSGSEMLIWGGGNDSVTFNDGAAYDPAEDTWRTMSASNAPSPRASHGAVWTGSRMVIWGGEQNGVPRWLNSGASWDPVADEWQPTTIDLATPCARSHHGMAWTGSRVVIWGGYDRLVGVPLTTNTGAFFDPSGNTWETLPVTAATPSPRAEFGTGSWTGREVIIWGGGNTSYCGDGGRLNPLTSSWQSIPKVPESAEARSAHASVWTGSGLVVWGGYPYSNGGGVYFPNTPPRAVGDIENSYGGFPDTLALGGTDPLWLNGAGSTNGSNPGSQPSYSDAWDSIVEFAWDLNGDVVLNASGELTAGSFDRFTAEVTIMQSELVLFGLDQPADKTLTLRVTDELGVRSWQYLTLHLVDPILPQADVVTPDGGETWTFSPSATDRRSHLIVWTASDNLGKARVKLSYSTKASPVDGDWTCIADSLAPGGDCAAGALTPESTSFLWTMPTQAEAGASVPPQTFPSSTARVRVEVWDRSGNRAAAASADPFYIIQPTSTSVQTLILTNTDRIGDSAAVRDKLLELAARDKVNGVVLDLKNAGLSTLYSNWDLDPTSVSKANTVADAIRAYVVSQVEGTYTGAKYLVLAGDDHVIPFYRVADFTATFPEHPNYDSQVDCASAVGSAICQNHYLSDAVYGDLEYTETEVGSLFVALPDLSTGRLVETPQEIMDTVDAFISQDGQINLNEVLVTGYDFLDDCAAHVRNKYNQAGKAVDLLNGGSWSSTDLENQLFTPPIHAIHNLNDHSNHYGIGTPNGILTSSTIDGHAGTPLVGTIFYNLGCHSGLNAPDAWAALYNPADLPQVTLRKGAVAYVGNTGYGWGLRNGVGYSERLMELVTEHLLSDSNGVLGAALDAAKREYYLENHRYDVFDEKSLLESTLYGLPMYRVVMNPSSQAPQKPELHAEGPDAQEAEGIRLVKSEASPETQEALPPTLTELTMNFSFGESTYAKINVPGLGDYYTLNGRCNGEIGDSLQPMFVFDSRLSDTVNHGVVFLGGHYLTETGFTPVVAVPQSSNLDVGAGPLAPGMGSLIGVISRTQAPQGQTLARGEASSSHLTRLTVYTGAYDSGTERRFDQMRFALYYSNETDTTEPVITDPGLDPAALHALDGMTARFSVQASDASGIYRVIVAYTEPTTDPQGNWVTFDLAYNAGTGRWEGDLALKRDITYFAQAVDNAGNVTYLTLTGPDIDGHGQPTGSTYKTARLFSIHLADTDGDGMPDAWETPHGLNPAVNDAGLDPDLDGLSNGGEFNASTDPQSADTDGDGDNDGSELNHGRSPLDPSDGKRITITLTKVGDDVQIDWPAGSGDNGAIDGPYWVYRSADPFFGPGELLNPYPNQVPTGTQTYTDVGGGSGPIQFYVVTNARYTGPAPVVNVIYPSTGPLSGGTGVNIYGANFASGAGVSFGALGASSVTVVNATTILCVTPPGAAPGAVDVTVTNPNGQFGTKAGGWTYE